MNAHAAPSLNERLRARDGDECWLCGGALDFSAAPNSKKAPTREHLLARSRGGGDGLDNLVLTHPGCNRMLGDREVEQKHKIRQKVRTNRAKLRDVGAAKAAGPRAEAAVVVPPRAAPVRRVQDDHRQLRDQLRRWQRLALVSAGTMLLAIGFAGGLLVSG